MVGYDFFDELMVVLVIYKMEISESPAFRSLTNALKSRDQRTSIFIYDNSPKTHTHTQNQNWVISYQNDPSNPGVSKAYNVGFEFAKAQKKKWILLIDQDTYFPIYFFDRVCNSLANNQEGELFVPAIKSESVLISPFRFKLGRGFVLQSVEAQTYSLHDLKFINSGLLISITLFEKCNGYDERFPLDFSDLAFIQRVKKYQSNFVVINAICTQNLSSNETVLSSFLHRFHYYVRGARLYGNDYGQSFFLFINRYYRAVKLSFQFKSLGFIKLLLQRG